jgi:hypothetical protein
VVSHISQKTSEIWGTPGFLEERKVGTHIAWKGERLAPHRVEGRKTGWDLFEGEAFLQFFYFGGWDAGDGGDVLPGFEVTLLLSVLHDGFCLWLG